MKKVLIKISILLFIVFICRFAFADNNISLSGINVQYGITNYPSALNKVGVVSYDGSLVNIDGSDPDYSKDYTIVSISLIGQITDGYSFNCGSDTGSGVDLVMYTSGNYASAQYNGDIHCTSAPVVNGISADGDPNGDPIMVSFQWVPYDTRLNNNDYILQLSFLIIIFILAFSGTYYIIKKVL